MKNNYYEENIRVYNAAHGIRALIFFVLLILVGLLNGYSLISNIGASLLTYSNYVFHLLELVLLIIFLRAAKESIVSIGFSLSNIKMSIGLGFLGGLLLAGGVCLVNDSLPVVNALSINLVFIFIIGAMSEEALFRGYIQTRMYGLIQNRFLSIGATAVLFLLYHYPVHWVVNGVFSLTSITFTHAIFILLLHVFCDFAYRKTNCIWGAVILHFIYNVITSMVQ